jgi:hypothetical protein
MARLTRAAAAAVGAALAVTQLVGATAAVAATDVVVEDFQDGDAAGWSLTPATSWSVVADPTAPANRVLKQGLTANAEAYAIAPNAPQADVDVSARTMFTTDAAGAYPGLLARYVDANNYYMCRINKAGENRVELSKKVAGASTILATSPIPAPTKNTWHGLRMTLQGSTIRCYVDGLRAGQVVDTALASGKVGIRTNWDAVAFDDVTVGTPGSAAVDAPSGVTVSRTTTENTLATSWQPVAGATTYRLYRSETADGAATNVYAGPSTQRVDAVPSARTYYYTVTAEVGGVESPPSTVASGTPFVAPPGAPTAPVVVQSDSTAVELTWEGTDSRASSYTVYRATTPGGPYTRLKTLAMTPAPDGTVSELTSAQRTTRDSDVTPGSTYYYAVTATSAGGESARSAETAVTVPVGAQQLVVNGGLWFDTDDDVIQAHGGSIIQVGSTYYWFGEDKGHNRAFLRGVSIYKSDDLLNWTFVREAVDTTSHPELALGNAKLERPKIVYDQATDQYVLWMHKEPKDNYNEAKMAVAVSDTVDGPYTYLGSFNPDPDKDGVGDSNRDFTIYKDDDGSAYLVAVARNNLDINIYRLTDDYTDVAELVNVLWSGQRREAPAVLKSGGKYYIYTSGQSGWAPNQGKWSVLSSLDDRSNPSPTLTSYGDNWTFATQPAFILQVQGTEATTSILVGDRWRPTALGTSEYIWMPIVPDATGVPVPTYVPRFAFDVTTGRLVAPQVQQLTPASVSASSTSGSTHAAGLAADGDYATYWEAGANASAAAPLRFDVDLGTATQVGRMDLSWRGVGGSEAYYSYKVFGSTDGADFSTLLADRSANVDLGFTSDSIASTQRFRYLRVVVTKATNFTNGNAPGYRPGLYEVKVYGKGAQSIAFTALPDRTFGEPGGPVAASSTSGLPVSYVVAGPCRLVEGTVEATGVGECRVTATQAGDGTYAAAEPVTRTFTVAPYTLVGFRAPVDLGVVNTAKGGSAIPLKFEVLRGSTELTDPSEITSVTFATVPADGTAPTDEIEALTTGDGGLRYDAAGGFFQYTWKTPKVTGDYRATVTTRDGSTLIASFRLR